MRYFLSKLTLLWTAQICRMISIFWLKNKNWWLRVSHITERSDGSLNWTTTINENLNKTLKKHQMIFIFLLLHSFLAMYFLTLRVFVDCLTISIANFLTSFEIFHLPNVFLPSVDRNYVTEILFDKYYQIQKKHWIAAWLY